MQALSERIRWYIDEPSTWDVLGQCVIIKGWCYGVDRQPITALRLRTRNLSFAGKIRLPRPDVKAAMSDAPDDLTGFDVRGILPWGSVRIVLEAQLPEGSWHRMFARTLTIKRMRRPLWAGGGSWTELMFFQMPGQMKHPPRRLWGERFPRPIGRRRRPDLTVVTPSYNQHEFLAEAVTSVSNQRGVSVQYRVQDGGSQDGSVPLLRALEKIGVHWSSESDAGQAEAIARGFEQTVGRDDDVMAWINADDFYLPGALAYVTGYFARNPDVDVIYGHRILVDRGSQEIGRWFLPPHDDEVLRLNDFVPQETLFWRRRIWEKAGGIDASFQFAMDWDLLLRFQAAGAKIVRVPYFLACFRIHSAQKTSAQMEAVGQQEIDALRFRSFGRMLAPAEIESHPRLIRYLRKSAWIEFLWRRFGVRAR